jgi:hypothetical protein
MEELQSDATAYFETTENLKFPSTNPSTIVLSSVDAQILTDKSLTHLAICRHAIFHKILKKVEQNLVKMTPVFSSLFKLFNPQSANHHTTDYIALQSLYCVQKLLPFSGAL